jgi:hypothetical protein
VVQGGHACILEHKLPRTNRAQSVQGYGQPPLYSVSKKIVDIGGTVTNGSRQHSAARLAPVAFAAPAHMRLMG